MIVPHKRLENPRRRVQRAVRVDDLDVELRTQPLLVFREPAAPVDSLDVVARPKEVQRPGRAVVRDEYVVEIAEPIQQQSTVSFGQERRPALAAANVRVAGGVAQDRHAQGPRLAKIRKMARVYGIETAVHHRQRRRQQMPLSLRDDHRQFSSASLDGLRYPGGGITYKSGRA